MDLSKLDKVVKDLTSQAENLVEFNKVFEELSALKDGISDNLKMLESGKKSLSGIENGINKRLTEAAAQIDKIEQALKDGTKKIRDSINQMSSANKKHQEELEDKLFKALERHKSDIKVEIRNEGNQIQRALELLVNTNYSNYTKLLEDKFDAQKKQFTIQTIMNAIIIVGILVIIGIMKL